MDSLYTPAMSQYIMSHPWPKGLRFDIVEYDYHLAIRFYRDNFVTFVGDDQVHIAMLIKEVIEKIRADGVPMYMEKAEGAG